MRTVGTVYGAWPDARSGTFEKILRLMNNDMEKRIPSFLEGIESRFGISILLAVEAGSRAWGFPSPDSDYDLRFIYRHPADWYLSVFDQKEVIGPEEDGLLDAAGWDVRKALRLLARSNATLFEWLGSPVVYRKEEAFFQEFGLLAGRFFQSRAVTRHYLGIARNMLAKEFQGDEVRIKKYFYVLRPVLAARWAAERKTPPPVRFDELWPAVIEDPAVIRSLSALLVQKAEAMEGARIRRLPELDAFILQQLALSEQLADRLPQERADRVHLDNFFRDLLKS